MLTHSQLIHVRDTLINSLDLNFVALAGGAPRDMYLGREPRDYDFYYTLSSVDVVDLEDLVEVGFTDPQFSGSVMTDPDGNEIVSITFNYANHIINLVLCEQTTIEGLFGTFGCSLSQFYYDFSTEQPVPNKAAKLSMATKTLTFTPEVSSYYHSKILNYFPDYTETCYDQLVFDLLVKEANKAPRSRHSNSRHIVDEVEGLFPEIPSMMTARMPHSQQFTYVEAPATLAWADITTTVSNSLGTSSPTTSLTHTGTTSSHEAAPTLRSNRIDWGSYTPNA